MPDSLLVKLGAAPAQLTMAQTGAAKALGLTVLPSLLIRADEVIE
ncbi:hypothetical protein [Bradyrhizobium arachidis]|nr:hypothetical protein [Bradyrhizobium arachidis]